MSSVRIDKWLWAVRICKTRKAATELCKQRKVLVEGRPVKPSKEVMLRQVVIVKRDGVEWQYRVIQCIDKRVSAPLSLKCREGINHEEAMEKLKLIKSDWMPPRSKGAGRPTKKERRDLEKLKVSPDNSRI